MGEWFTQQLTDTFLLQPIKILSKMYQGLFGEETIHVHIEERPFVLL